MKTIKFVDSVWKFGHPAWDYKKDGTLKKNPYAQIERSYCVEEEVKVKCKEVYVDGHLIGYYRTDEEKRDYDCHGYIEHKYGLLYNENGQMVMCAYGTPNGKRIHYAGISLFEGHNKQYVISRPFHCVNYYIPLWICDANDEDVPAYIFEGCNHPSYDWATEMWERSYWHEKTWHEYEKEFSEKYGNLPTIKMECSYYSDYYYKQIYVRR